jgi:hypothetical protein
LLLLLASLAVLLLLLLLLQLGVHRQIGTLFQQSAAGEMHSLLLFQAHNNHTTVSRGVMPYDTTRHSSK